MTHNSNSQRVMCHIKPSLLAVTQTFYFIIDGTLCVFS